ncbi:MAG: hypothetical protein QOF93_781, partial [Verrucomicrobiota bacterium]
AGLLQGKIDMLGGERIRLWRADHSDLAMEFFSKQRRAQIVNAHVRGQNDSAFRRGQLIQEPCALEFVPKPSLRHPIGSGIGQRPSEIREHPKDAQVISDSPRTGTNQAQISQQCLARRRRDEKKQECCNPDYWSMEKPRKLAHRPIDKFSPENSVHGQPVPPASLSAGHASAGVTADLGLAGAVAVEANISRRFVSSAFHQRNNPLRSNFVTRKSGTNPSYNSRQPALCFAK